MGSNEGHVWVSLSGVGHVEMSEGFNWVNMVPIHLYGKALTSHSSFAS